MLFGIDADVDEVSLISEERFDTLDIWERRDLQEWILEAPRILGEDLLIIDKEYQNFVQTRDRLDLLALDTEGKLVVVELKRDEADETTDLQALKYASYCATLTAEDLQKDYLEANNDGKENLSPDDVGDEFANHLADAGIEVQRTEEGWAEFELSNTPRIMLAAGSFSTEITSPVMWLVEEFDMDITCVQLKAYEHSDEILLSSRQIIPIPETEEYMARRRRKKRETDSSRRPPAINVLLDRNVLQKDDILFFDPDSVPTDADRSWDPEIDYWRAQVTGKRGRVAVEWEHDDETYSFTRLTKVLLEDLVGRDTDEALNGYQFWCHPVHEGRTMSDLRNSGVEGTERPVAEPSEYFD